MYILTFNKYRGNIHYTHMLQKFIMNKTKKIKAHKEDLHFVELKGSSKRNY